VEANCNETLPIFPTTGGRADAGYVFHRQTFTNLDRGKMADGVNLPSQKIKMWYPEYMAALTENFPHLNNAPIHEAVLELRGDIVWTWDKTKLTEALKLRLPDYPLQRLLQKFEGEVMFKVDPKGSSSPGVPSHPVLEFNGIRVDSADKLHIAQFRRDAFAFSRLRPYANFTQLIGEASRVWTIYEELMKPTQIHRVGMRFINQIPLKSPEFEILLRNPPRPPEALGDAPFVAFTHQDSFAVNGKYTVKVVCTIQPKVLLVDIDVATMGSFRSSTRDAFVLCDEMRALKNKVFFSVLSDEAIEEFKCL